MSAALRNHLLIVLEQAARDELAKPWRTSIMSFIKCDTSASPYGVLMPRLCHMTGWSGDRLRYHLRAMEKDGQVVAYQSRAGGMRTYWPVGLFDKLKREREVQKGEK